MAITKQMTMLYSAEKNTKLKLERGITFEDIKLAIINDHEVLFEPHPNQAKYPNQWLIYILIDNYFHVVPFIMIDEETVFLKTIYRSHKINQLLRGNDHATT